jgi:hypothetical protein
VLKTFWQHQQFHWSMADTTAHENELFAVKLQQGACRLTLVSCFIFFSKLASNLRLTFSPNAFINPPCPKSKPSIFLSHFWRILSKFRSLCTVTLSSKSSHRAILLRFFIFIFFFALYQF